MPHIPKPFKRPGIDLTPAGPKKEWRRVEAAAIQVGDIVRGKGLVVDTKWFATERGGRLEFKSGAFQSYGWMETEIAFTNADGELVDG